MKCPFCGRSKYKKYLKNRILFLECQSCGYNWNMNFQQQMKGGINENNDYINRY